MAINASLMTLGRCLEALRWNQQHPAAEQRLVPYREARVRIHCCLLAHASHPGAEEDASRDCGYEHCCSTCTHGVQRFYPSAGARVSPCRGMIDRLINRAFVVCR